MLQHTGLKKDLGNCVTLLIAQLAVFSSGLCCLVLSSSCGPSSRLISSSIMSGM